ncbi:MAG: hypothetical protein IT374_07570 [Polyangiaceae bacterium]|nr:hypothetical protein [Polyangiaceae bacterium]
MRTFLIFSTVSASLLLSSGALAQKKSKVVEISEITITGRVQKPVAAVDISKIAPKVALSELRHPFLEKIEQVLLTDPF